VLERVEHSVERARQFGDLPGRGDLGEPLRGVAGVLDRARGGRQPPQRPQSAAGDERDQQATDRGGGDRAQRDDCAHPPERLGHIAQ